MSELPTPLTPTHKLRPNRPEMVDAVASRMKQSTAHSPDIVFPRVGETLGEFYLVTELGRGASGRVYLALQLTLNNRPVVVKAAPPDAQEHLLLARLQHTHIMPLLFAQEFPERNLRVLCEPYLGTTTLAKLLRELQDRPVGARSGRQVLAILDRAAEASTMPLTAHGPERGLLESSTYVESICWMAVHLAEALYYAHQRGLVHLDLKPSNILLGLDGQPLILDFDVARSRLAQGEAAPSWLGGTPGYISPEQQAALEAVPRQEALPMPLDGRSDIYSLGVVLCDALGGAVSTAGAAKLPTPAVSVGLGDIVRKCLQPAMEQRYASADHLAADLRRHLQNQPLRWVGNRSWRERWQKWRRRRPYHLPLLAVLTALALTAFAAAWMEWHRLGDRRHAAEQALFEGQAQLAQGQFAEAERSLQRGQDLAEQLLGDAALRRALEQRLRLAQRGQKAQELRAVVEQLNFLAIDHGLAPLRLHVVDASCRNLWEMRELLRGSGLAELGTPAETAIEGDLRDLAVLWTELRLHLAPSQRRALRLEALTVLDQAEELVGASHVFFVLRQRHASQLGQRAAAEHWAAQAARLKPRTCWDHLALGRYWLQEGDWDQASRHLKLSRATRSLEFLPQLYDGVRAHRQGHLPDAIVAFSVCVGLVPRPESHYFRAGAFAAAGQVEQALSDLNQALELNPEFAAAALERGIVQHRRQHLPDARKDIERALRLGAEPARAHYHLALVQLDMGDRPAARLSLENALRFDGPHQHAKALLEKFGEK